MQKQSYFEACILCQVKEKIKHILQSNFKHTSKFWNQSRSLLKPFQYISRDQIYLWSSRDKQGVSTDQSYRKARSIYLRPQGLCWRSMSSTFLAQGLSSGSSCKQRSTKFAISWGACSGLKVPVHQVKMIKSSLQITQQRRAQPSKWCLSIWIGLGAKNTRIYFHFVGSPF